MTTLQQELPGCGYRRVTAELHRQQWQVNHKTLKREEVYLNQHESFTDAEDQLGRCIDDVYNQKRRNGSLGHLPPVECESLCNAAEGRP